MKPEELRIGNWVHEPYSGDMMVSCIHRIPHEDSYDIFLQKEKGLFIGRYDLDSVSPITITEEWLEKFGFISNPYEDRYEIEDFHIHCDKTKGFLDLWVTNCRVDLKYIHQLQNLYFALTGKEL